MATSISPLMRVFYIHCQSSLQRRSLWPNRSTFSTVSWFTVHTFWIHSTSKAHMSLLYSSYILHLQRALCLLLFHNLIYSLAASFKNIGRSHFGAKKNVSPVDGKYLCICGRSSWLVCLQDSTHWRRSRRIFSRTSGESFGWPMMMSSCRNWATKLFTSPIICNYIHEIICYIYTAPEAIGFSACFNFYGQYSIYINERCVYIVYTIDYICESLHWLVLHYTLNE